MTKLPPYVQRLSNKGPDTYRARVVSRGRHLYSETYDNPHEAYEAALRMMEARTGLTAKRLGYVIDYVIAQTKTRCQPDTVRWYQSNFKAITKHWSRKTWIDHITPGEIEEWVEQRLSEVRPYTVKQHLAALRRLFRIAIRRGWAKESPLARVDPIRARTGRFSFFTEVEIKKVLRRLREQDDECHDLVLALTWTGLRLAEFLRIQPGDLNEVSGKLVVDGKTGIRSLDVPPKLAPALRRFVGKLTKAKLRKIIERARKLIGDPRLHCHALRHSFGTIQLQRGVPLEVVKELMGHATLHMTLRYARVADEAKKQAMHGYDLLDDDPQGASARGGHG